MSRGNRPLRRRTVASLLIVGMIAGIVVSARFSWIPHAGSAETAPLATPAGPTQNFASLAKAAMPAVVNISTTRVVRGGGGGAGGGGGESAEKAPPFNDPFFRRFFGDEFFRRFQAPRERREAALGSGVIVSSDGYIVTSNHVVEKAEQIKVLLPDKREFVGKVIGTDPPTEIAVIKIDAKNLTALPWGDSDKLQVGEYVLAVGNPFALNSTVTMGIVSAVGRANVGIADYEDFIQTDAAINPGNSGGALINTRGEVIGINTAIFSESGGYMGIGFAVPSNMARIVMASLLKNGKVTRGWLGVSVQDVNQDLAKQFGLSEAKGALVSEVLPDSPAAAAGVKAGDVITEIDGKTVDSAALLRNAVAQTPIGQTVKLSILRNNNQQSLDVKIAERPKEMAQREPQGPSQQQEPGKPSALSGLAVQDLTPEMVRDLGLAPGTRGVVVTDLAPSSAAATAGIQPGDIIVEVNRQPVRSVAELKQIASKLKEKDSALLLINRQGGRVFLVVKP